MIFIGVPLIMTAVAAPGFANTIDGPGRSAASAAKTPYILVIPG